MTIHAADTVMNDKYEIDQAGAVGPDSSFLQGLKFTQVWREQKSEINLGELTKQLCEVRRAGHLSAHSRGEYVALADLVHAEDAAKRGDGPRALSHLARAGDWALGIAVSIDALVAVEALKTAIEGAEPGWPELTMDDNHPSNPGGSIMRDQYNVNKAGAVGPRSTAHHISFTQVWDESDIDLPALGKELTALRTAMRRKASTPAHDMAIAEVASAEVAAEKGDGPSVLEHLARAGRWALGIASAIGAALAAEVIKKAAGL